MGQSTSSPAGQASAVFRRENDTSVSSSSAAWSGSELKQCTFRVYHGLASYSLMFLAANVLLLAALLAGLVLGLCSLNMTLLQLRAATGGTLKERKQARAVLILKKHETWMLCSLIIVSVAMSESFPFLIQSLYPGGKVWLSILISTLCLAIVGEIIPQYIIPRRAIAWGYHFRYLVWFCMGFTAIISYPLAWCLDRVGGQKDALELFTNEELMGIIRYHERSEKQGGYLGQDASRVMLGALKLDSRKVGGEITPISKPQEPEMDIEKADLVVVEGMIVKWSAVKMVRMDDPVDDAFIMKIREWSYSRIPVIGTDGHGKGRDRDPSDISDWSEDTRIYGFFHTKCLIGLDFKSPGNAGTPFLVKDLPLYPLPIVREDMSIYELLNMFQTGMSRLAVIVTTSVMTCGVGPVWTLTEKTNDETMNKMKERAKGNSWSMDFLMAAEALMDAAINEKCEPPGIKTPKPIGIVTYEDLIDTLLQKTSLDEKDFYDRGNLSPPTKTRKAGDFPVDMAALAEAHASSGCKPPQTSLQSLGSLRMVKNTLRRRKFTNEKTVCAVDRSHRSTKPRAAPGAMDGAYDNSNETQSDDLNVKKTRGLCVESSYTSNSQGGFHNSSHSVDNGNMLTAEDVAELAAAASSGHHKPSFQSSTMRNPPSPRHDSRSSSSQQKQKPRHVSAAPKLPTSHRVTPFSRDTVTCLGKENGNDLVMPDATAAGEQSRYDDMKNPNASKFNNNESMKHGFERSVVDMGLGRKPDIPKESGHTVSLQSGGDEQEEDEDLSALYDAFPIPLTHAAPEGFQVHSSVPITEEVEKKYTGFPMELLEEDKENRTPKYISSTMPRTMGADDLQIFGGMTRQSPLGREQSFHDDRSLLPSQRRSAQQDEDSVSGIRRTSLWF